MYERRLGSRYVLTDLLGRGAMGQVFRARVEPVGSGPLPAGPAPQVAVKLLREELGTDPDHVTRFLREGRLLKSIEHPNVVRILDLVAEGDQLAIVMDLVEAGDLRHAVTTPCAEWLAASIVAGVADGLAAVHAAGILHRDLKPENVLVETGPGGVARPRISDFGIARFDTASAAESRGMTGTIGYMAPEITRGDSPTPAADMYALGVILYELCAGHGPFRAGNQIAMIRAHAEDPPPRPPAMSDRMWELVSRLLAKEPAARPPAAEVAQWLRVLGTSPGPAQDQAPPGWVTLPPRHDPFAPAADHRPAAHEQAAHEQAAHGQAAHGQAAYGQAAYGQAAYEQAAYGPAGHLPAGYRPAGHEQAGHAAANPGAAAPATVLAGEQAPQNPWPDAPGPHPGTPPPGAPYADVPYGATPVPYPTTPTPPPSPVLSPPPGTARPRTAGTASGRQRTIVVVAAAAATALLAGGAFWVVGSPSDGTGSSKAAPGAAAGVPEASAGPRATAVTEAGATVPTDVETARTYRLLNAVTRKCLGRTGSSISQLPCGSTTTDQAWVLQPTRTADAPLYWLRNPSGARLCLDVPGDGPMPAGTELHAATCPDVARAGHSNDEWKLLDSGLTDQGRTQYALVNWMTGLCLDVSFTAADKADLEDGRSMTLFTCHEEKSEWDDHLWIFS